MDKLKLLALHLTELPLRQHPGVVGTSAFLPGGEQQAVAFGWASINGKPLQPKRHWICQLGPSGTTSHWLPDSLNQHYAQRVGWSPGTESCNKFMHAFRCGQSIGLLLGLHELQLFDLQTERLRTIPIEGFPIDARWVPLRIGNGHQDQFPVILSDPSGAYFDGRHLALLQVDPMAERARWQLLSDGQPVALNEMDYAPVTPLIYSAAWRGKDWLFYVGPKHTSHHRSGMRPSVLGLHGANLRLQQVIHQAAEDSFGDLSSCGQWLIVSPYRRNGPRKGRQTLVNLHDGRVLEPSPPRGHAGWQVVDHFDGCWWLQPMGQRHSAGQILACAEK
jgi:hypothetical protein